MDNKSFSSRKEKEASMTTLGINDINVYAVHWPPGPLARYKDARRGVQLSLPAAVSLLSLQEESEGQPSQTKEDEAAEENIQIIFRLEFNYLVRVESEEAGGRYKVWSPSQS